VVGKTSRRGFFLAQKEGGCLAFPFRQPLVSSLLGDESDLKVTTFSWLRAPPFWQAQRLVDDSALGSRFTLLSITPIRLGDLVFVHLISPFSRDTLIISRGFKFAAEDYNVTTTGKREEKLVEEELLVEHECTLVAYGERFCIRKDGREVGHARVWFLLSEGHKELRAELADVYVDESARKRGLATKLVQRVIEEARKKGCYRLDANSRFERPWVHKLYERLGFKKNGFAFRLDFAPGEVS